MCWAGQRERAGLDRLKNLQTTSDPGRGKWQFDAQVSMRSDTNRAFQPCSTLSDGQSCGLCPIWCARPRTLCKGGVGCPRPSCLSMSIDEREGLRLEFSMNELQPPQHHHQVGTIQWLSAPQKRSMHCRAVQRWDRPCCRDRHRRVRCVVRDSNSGHQLLWLLLSIASVLMCSFWQ